MKKRTFFLTAVILGAVALVLHGAGYDHMARASSRHALGIQRAYLQHTKYVPDAEVVRLGQSARVLNAVGLVFTFSSVAALVTAAIRHEPGWYSDSALIFRRYDDDGIVSRRLWPNKSQATRDGTCGSAVARSASLYSVAGRYPK